MGDDKNVPQQPASPADDRGRSDGRPWADLTLEERKALVEEFNRECVKRGVLLGSSDRLRELEGVTFITTFSSFGGYELPEDEDGDGDDEKD
jgi:hypothetical protein